MSTVDAYRAPRCARPAANGGQGGHSIDESTEWVQLISFEDLQAGAAPFANTLTKLRGLALHGRYRLREPSMHQRRSARYAAALVAAITARRARRVAYHRMHPLTPIAMVLSGSGRAVLELNGAPSDASTAYCWLKPFERLNEAGFHYCLRNAKLVVTATTALAELARERDATKPTLVAPVPAPDVEPSDLPPWDGLSPRSYAVYFGSFAPWQGIELLSEAVEGATWPNGLRLVLVGDHRRCDQAQRLARHPDVIALGRQPRDVTFRIAAHALCSVSPKTYQAGDRRQTGQWPIKVVESLAVGTPVVVTDAPDQNRLIEESRGGMVVPATPEAIACAVRRYEEDPLRAARDGASGRRYVSQNCSLSVTAQAVSGAMNQFLPVPRTEAKG